MKVLYFHQHFSTPSGSTGTRSYEMSKALIAAGHSVTMVCGRFRIGSTELSQPFIYGMRRGIVEGIHIVEFDLLYSNSDSFFKRSLIFLKFSLRSIRLVFTESYDIIFATTTPLTAGIPGIFAKWLLGKSFVFEVRDLWPELPRAMGVIRNPIILIGMSILEWLSYKSANQLIGLSPGIVEGIVAKGIDRSRVTMVPNGCDMGIFSRSANCWRPIGVAETDLMAVFAGTHGVANGLDEVLNAAAVLKLRRRKNIKIVLIGDGKLKPYLKLRANQEQLDNVIFIDPISKKKLSGILASSDIGLQILANVPEFYFGTSPNKFFDYIASGLPVLNNYPGWLASIITDIGCGYVVSPNDPEAFADALESAANNRDILDEMGKAALKLAQNTFDRNRLSRDWIAVLEKTYKKI
jgi:glycosyltransferase involved in cell wall biosynthesis